MSPPKFRILIVASPRSGSSYLRSSVDGTNPIFGEILLKTSTDPLSLQLLNVEPRSLWDYLSTCDRSPSAVPGEPSMAGRNFGHVVGVKVMGAEFLGRNYKRALHLFLGADLIVFIWPVSFFRQVWSLYRIRMGGSAHYYVQGEKGRDQHRHGSQAFVPRAFLKSFLVILANRIACILLDALARGLGKQRLLAHQSQLVSAQRSVRELSRKDQLPSDGA